jgi:dTDP-4-amino-4,6-dideoxygalactose transaminase
MPITVTKPSLPPLEEFIPYLEDIWKRKILTNGGLYHQEFENELCKYLKIPYLSVFTNGTFPLTLALQALRISGEVITTPYSFVATTHAVQWNRLTPVFVDIDYETGNISPEKIEQAITPLTTAILAVHCYGTICKVDEIAEIADKYGLRVIYDAAHCFGIEIEKKSILEYGDMATLSFHATKTFNTLEGGALVCRDRATKMRIDNLKNFGFTGETQIIMPGINGKMDEVRAALGLLQLRYIDGEMQKRKLIAELYREKLKDISGIRYLAEIENIKHNYNFFPVFINEKQYGWSRDELYANLKENDILTRRYFYPLISEFLPYKNLQSSDVKNLPNATKLSREVICLPMYAGLEVKDVERICKIISKKG